MTGNILFNPTLTGDTLLRKEDGHSGIEFPDGWNPIYSEIDGEFPDILHRDNGFEIGGGFRKWRAGLGQSKRVDAGQRYVLKARFTPESNAELNWRFEVQFDGQIVDSGWSSNLAQHGSELEHLLVIEPRRDLLVTIRFMGKDDWPDDASKITIHAITLEPVDEFYAPENVRFLGDDGVPTVPTPPVFEEPPVPPDASVPVTFPQAAGFMGYLLEHPLQAQQFIANARGLLDVWEQFTHYQLAA